MFEGLADSGSRAELADADIDAAIASASAHRLLLIAEKTRRNYDDDWDSLEDTDAAWNSAAAEISLASKISHGRASSDMEVGLALTRLPKIAAALLAGQISEFLVRRVVHRTANIQDAEVLAKVESKIVERALHWDGLSKQKLDDAIDAIDAAYADFDHTVPWPAGPTHASGGKLLCRRHHLAKTFWPGWSEIQHPDGTVIWTTPTGRTYTTKPGSALLFPTVNTTSAPIDIPTQQPTSRGKIKTMPTRRNVTAPKQSATASTPNAHSTTPTSPNATNHRHFDPPRHRQATRPPSAAGTSGPRTPTKRRR